ncbi:MAG: cold shock domain-containing protein [Candidatus Woesearchaeota archaeon]|jgi:CspA family cold shock protein|nr:cold shock domain-containing protein [Candidatus Woesearchaeota archaeon]
MKGTIKWYRKEKGYGFITGEDEKDYFLHLTALPQNVDNVEGKEVEFEVETTQRGVQATKIVFPNSPEKEV